LKTGEYAGCIGINEMVAVKLPLELYERYMYEAHHRQPLEEEEKLEAARQNAEMAVAASARHPVSLEVEEGSDELGRAPEPPSFHETLTDRSRHR